ncbi:autophagy-type protein 22 [Obba rivulosa]|uniref:Autophagy-related protein n=1 Tax=Obba rivulosa TaxID=1052685 RepID=A0A8E2AY30_9APHY|nr:autophagy-type protein 22 [Obba rivulosa]
MADAAYDELAESPAYDDKNYKRHLRGWMSYAFASEVFAIVSLTLFLPICLEQFARDHGYLLPDRTQRCTTAVANSTVQAQVDGEEVRCVVKLAWMWIDTASFSLYVFSTSVALQAITVISMGGIADHPPHRKRVLLSFAALGFISAMLFLILPSSSPLWPLSALLAVCANVGFGVSIVALNAYLPALASGAKEVIEADAEVWRVAHQHHPQRQSAADESSREAGTEATAEGDQAEPLLAQEEHTADPEVADAKAARNKILSTATARISSHGIALGYIAGILMVLLALIPVRALGGSTFALQLAIGLTGVWWALFSVPAAMWLPGGEGVKAESWEEPRSAEAWNARREILRAWKKLGDMLRWREIMRLKNTFIYLAAWFLLSDGFTTITSTAILFGKTTLHMPASSLLLVGALAPGAGILGSIMWPIIQRRAGWSNLRVLITLVILASLIPAYGCLGFLPVFQHGARVGGLTTAGEMYGLAVLFGIVYGAFQGYARAFYAELIPPGEEARWYGLYSITDKSSSFVGPLIVGLIADTTGNIRYAFFFLVVMVWLAVPLLAKVDVEQGRKDAKQYALRQRDIGP